MLFCDLTKGIYPKTCILCLCVIVNKRSFEPFCVWTELSCIVYGHKRTAISAPVKNNQLNWQFYWTEFSWTEVNGHKRTAISAPMKSSHLVNSFWRPLTEFNSAQMNRSELKGYQLIYLRTNEKQSVNWPFMEIYDSVQLNKLTRLCHANILQSPPKKDMWISSPSHFSSFFAV